MFPMSRRELAATLLAAPALATRNPGGDDQAAVRSGDRRGGVRRVDGLPLADGRAPGDVVRSVRSGEQPRQFGRGDADHPRLVWSRRGVYADGEALVGDVVGVLRAYGSAAAPSHGRALDGEERQRVRRAEQGDAAAGRGSIRGSVGGGPGAALPADSCGAGDDRNLRTGQRGVDGAASNGGRWWPPS